MRWGDAVEVEAAHLILLTESENVTASVYADVLVSLQICERDYGSASSYESCQPTGADSVPVLESHQQLPVTPHLAAPDIAAHIRGQLSK